MEVQHPHMLKLLGDYWDKWAIELGPFETLNLVDWAFKYNNELNRYGVHDDGLESGFVKLCNAYARKIHSQLIPMMINILRAESDPSKCLETDFDGKKKTSMPTQLM